MPYSMAAVAHQRGSTTLGAVFLPISVVAGYALVTGIGIVWPQRPVVAIVSSIVVSIVLWVASALWFLHRTGWPRVLGIGLFAATFVFPMVGGATLGTDLALEQKADQVTGRVSDIDVEQTNSKEGEEAWKTTYTFVADDGRELGTVDYRGGRDAYGFEVGDDTELMVDPSGDLPVKLAERVDSGDDIAMLAVGGVLFAICYAIGLFVPMIWRPRETTEWWP